MAAFLLSFVLLLVVFLFPSPPIPLLSSSTSRSIIACALRAPLSFRRGAGASKPRLLPVQSGGGHEVSSVLFALSPPQEFLLALRPLLPILAGSLAGSIGVGAAYPLDSIKTKTQTLSAASEGGGERSLGLLGIALLVYKKEGLAGFYGGVWSTMAGQAVIKALAFSSNAWALGFLVSSAASGSLASVSQQANLLQLTIAACFSGMIVSFVSNPLERIKILMQTDDKQAYKSSYDCFVKVLASDGLSGLVLRGVDATLAREIPGYGLYFVLYSVLIRSPLGVAATSIGLGSLLCGALAGMLSWIPVYPFDVVKTYMQNTQGGSSSSTSTNNSIDKLVVGSEPKSSSSMIDTAIYMNDRFGAGIFWDGLSSKLLRACVNHAVTFAVYDLIMQLCA